MRKAFPKTGLDWADIKEQLSEARKDDVDWRGGKITGLVYFAGDDVMQVAQDAYTMFFGENAVYPTVYPSLAMMESEVIELTLELLHGGESAVGGMSTGGTESIFLALKAARDWSVANRPVEGTPEIVVPRTAHPAFDRAAGYLGMKIVRIPQGPDFRADVNAMAEAITQSTIMLVGSAPQYPHGVIDPIGDLGELAQSRDLWLHVDACVGGFIAPFVRKLGYPIPDFDFAVPGVTSISADIHKNGYSAKGASTVLYCDSEYFRFQGFEFDQWARGRYATSTFTGSRPGGAVASAWAVMHYLGEEGYMRIAQEVMHMREALMEGVNRVDGLET
ncbi:MAG: aspartate aminotransferase family protein, partial [Dehalococcoidia bacterium]